MSLPPAKILVSVSDRDVCLRITGRANFTSGPDFKTLVTELQQRGFRHFVIDMSECLLMDSTFLGLLCGLGLKLSENGNGDSGVELLNANPRVTELLESLGVMSLVKLVSGDREMTGATMRCCEPHSREETAHTSLEAHQTLMSLSPENVARFKDVAQFLAEDLKRIKAGGAQSEGNS
jgi:anti-sigma B factor antagonist